MPCLSLKRTMVFQARTKDFCWSGFQFYPQLLDWNGSGPSHPSPILKIHEMSLICNTKTEQKKQ